MISKKLFTAGINSDDADILVDPKEYLNALNIRFATTESGKIGQLSNVEGNSVRATTINSNGTQIAWVLPSGVNTTIGAVEDTPNRRIFFFNKNSNGNDGIYCYDADTILVYSVLLAYQVEGGLSFNANIHSVAIIDNLLYWTDGIQPQRRINVEAGIKLNHPTYSTTVSPYVSTGLNLIKQSVITVIRNQPWSPLTIEKLNQAGYVNNFIKSEAFQFAYRFVYRDYEVSTFSPLSALSNYNTSTETFNKITVTIPESQKIEQDVIRIEVAVRFVVGGKYFIIKSFDSGFSAHNTGTLLAFDFFNDTIGLAVDDVSSFKQYDTIPLKSQTLEIAKNRLFLGNNYDGYESPKTTSLTKSTITGGGSTVTAQWYMITYETYQNQFGDSLITYIGNIGAQSGFYYNGTYNDMQNPPTSIDFTLMTYLGQTVQDIQPSQEIPIQTFYTISFLSNVGSVTNAPPVSSIINDIAFKSDSSYRLGIVFYDEAGRKCGVTTNENLKVVTPDRSYSTVSYVTEIAWSLDNQNPVAEIPSWAKYYSVVMTKGLRTSFFMQLKANAIKWVTKNNDGNYTVVDAYNAVNYGLAVDVKSLYSIGYGYSFQEGDLIKLYKENTPVVTLSVRDTFGSYVVCDNYNISGDIIYEIYSPYVQAINEPYYERAATFPILNAGTSTRSYSIVSGSFKGDITILQRTMGGNYLVEAMSPSDLNWKNWNTDAGRPNIVVDIKPANKRTSVYFSNVIVLGSQTNGLSTFDVLDQTQLPYELSSIQKLQLVSKVESEGTVMLAVGEQETASMYLGESQVFDNSGSSFLAKSSGVIGNVNVMRGSYGTINPESITRYMGNVYWFDANKGAVVSYSVNGLFPISSNKMQKYFRKVGQDILSKGLKFYGGVDPYHNEILMFAPRKSANPEGARLTDMVLISNNYSVSSSTVSITVIEGREYLVSAPVGVTVTYNGELVTSTFIAVASTGQTLTVSQNGVGGQITLTEIVRGYYDAYDAQGGVWSYQPSLDKWTSQYSFRPEWMTLVGNRLVTFKDGKPYIHDSSTRNTFYGQTYDSVVALNHNEGGNVTKSYLSLSVEGSTPSLVHTRTEVPNVQSSDIRLAEFEIKEGVNYAPIYRDRLSPNTAGNYEQKLFDGDMMRGDIGKFQVNYTLPTTEKILKLFNIGFVASRGHNTIPENG